MVALIEAVMAAMADLAQVIDDPDIAAELVKLQDRVPPFPNALARAEIERSFEQPVEAVFDEFEESPLASASIAQVHPATLHDGRDAVVKVVRPGIGKQLRKDIDLLLTIAGLAERFGMSLEEVAEMHLRDSFWTT